MLYLKIFKILLRGLVCVCWGNWNNSFRIQYIHKYTWIWNSIDVKTPDFSSKMINFHKNRHFRKPILVMMISDRLPKMSIFVENFSKKDFWPLRNFMSF